MPPRFDPVFSTPFFTIQESYVPGSNGRPYYRLCSQDSAITCILDQTDSFVMVRQYRPNLDFMTIESPAGGIEEGETPLQAARREIAEETGLTLPLLHLGHHFHLMMNRTNIRDFLFFGMLPERLPGFKEEEGVQILKIPRKDLLGYAVEGKYLQLAGLGLLQLVSAILGIDILRSSYDEILKAFESHPGVSWNNG